MINVNFRLMRKAEVMRTVGLRESMLRRLEKEGKFPRRIPLTRHAIAWKSNEIEDWMRAKVAAARGGQSEQAAA